MLNVCSASRREGKPPRSTNSDINSQSPKSAAALPRTTSNRELKGKIFASRGVELLGKKIALLTPGRLTKKGAGHARVASDPCSHPATGCAEACQPVSTVNQVLRPCGLSLRISAESAALSVLNPTPVALNPGAVTCIAMVFVPEWRQGVIL